MSSWWARTRERLTRRKLLNLEEDSALPRVLTLVDLTALGVGSTIGVGFYVLAGDVALHTAGPAVSISFLIAAIASVFAGLCYAEFGGRVPKAGSAYIYTYVCVGEFVAFVIGWNLILEYVIGTASVASGFSGYINELANHSISEALRDAMPINVPYLSLYPDFLAGSLCMALSALLSVGVKDSSRFNNVITLVNLCVIVYVIIAAATKADFHNWVLTPEEVSGNGTGSVCGMPDPVRDSGSWGTGGFAPYGLGGIMQGAATCFYGFIGFDVIASTGEEAIRPERNLPVSICLSLLLVFISYFSLSTVLTLALPYCLQDPHAPLIYLFESLEMNTAMWIVSIGAMFGFSASLLGSIFPMPRIIYAMADDGLMFRPLAAINKRVRTPVFATLVSGLFAGTMATIFDLGVLVHMMSIGTLQAYTIVALCVMLLRYSLDPLSPEHVQLTGSRRRSSASSRASESFSIASYLRQATNADNLKHPNTLSSSFVSYATLAFLVICAVLCVLLVALGSRVAAADPVSIVVIVVLVLMIFIVLVLISMQPQSSTKLAFKVPLVPWLPALSCFINLYLMCNLPVDTWIKFAIWMTIGFVLYFGYGQFHSQGERHRCADDANEGDDDDESDDVDEEDEVHFSASGKQAAVAL